jgi:hypothetical protein
MECNLAVRMKNVWKGTDHVDVTEYNVRAVDILTETELLHLYKHVTFSLLKYFC